MNRIEIKGNVMNPTFLKHSRPLLTTMIQVQNPDDAIVAVRNALFDGADAFGFQICQFDPQYRTEETYKTVFSFMEDKPIYITNYRYGFSRDYTDEQRAEELLVAIKAGATLCDIMGDLYDPSPLELTKNREAIEKQKKLIEHVHEMGGEALMSSHINQFLPTEQVIEVAKEQEARGIDIVKIVTQANSEEELLENLKTSVDLKKELNIPFLFLANGCHCKLQRIIGPMFGSVMYLCVQQYDKLASKNQPLLRSTREVLNHMDWKPNRS